MQEKFAEMQKQIEKLSKEKEELKNNTNPVKQTFILKLYTYGGDITILSPANRNTFHGELFNSIQSNSAKQEWSPISLFKIHPSNNEISVDIRTIIGVEDLGTFKPKK